MISFLIHTILTSPHIKELKNPLIRLLCLWLNSSCCSSCSSCFTPIVARYYRPYMQGAAVFITTGNAPCAGQWQRQATELALLRSSFTSSWDSCSIPRHSAFRSCSSWSWERKGSTAEWRQEKRRNSTQPTPAETCTGWCSTIRFFQAHADSWSGEHLHPLWWGSMKSKLRLERGKYMIKSKGKWKNSANTATADAKSKRRTSLKSNELYIVNIISNIHTKTHFFSELLRRVWPPHLEHLPCLAHSCELQKYLCPFPPIVWLQPPSKMRSPT